MTTTMITTPDTMTATPGTRPEPVPVDPLELVPRVLDLVRQIGRAHV